MDLWEDLGGTRVISAVVGIAAALLSLPVIRWLLPPDHQQINWKCAIAAVCMALFLESTILLGRAARKGDSAKRLFLMRSLAVYFAALAGGQISGVLWISGTLQSQQIEVLGIVSVLSFFAVFLVVAEIQRWRNSS